MAVGQIPRTPAARISTRHHVNPLMSRLMEPLQPVQWEEHLVDPSLPLHLDVGCGDGSLMRAMAAAQPARNWLGVDIRDSYIAGALGEVPVLGNLHYVQANLLFNAGAVLGSLPAPVASVSVMYPDPWFKAKHHKRRLMTAEFLAALAPYVAPGAPLHFQSDSWDLFAAAEELLLGDAYFRRTLPDPTEPPFPVPTYFQQRTTELEGRRQFMLGARRTDVPAAQ